MSAYAATLLPFPANRRNIQGSPTPIHYIKVYEITPIPPITGDLEWDVDNNKPTFDPDTGTTIVTTTNP